MVAKSLYQMGVVVLVVSAVWVILSVYWALRETAEVEVDKILLEPLNPVINMEVLGELNKRRQMTESDWSTLSQIVVEVEPPEVLVVESSTIENQVELPEETVAQP